MKFRLSYSYVYACIATIADNIEEVHIQLQNLYVETKTAAWRKKVADNLKEFYPLVVDNDVVHTIDAESFDRTLGVIKYLTPEDIGLIKDLGLPELDAMGLSIRKYLLGKSEYIATTTKPKIDKPTQQKDSGGNIPWN